MQLKLLRWLHRASRLAEALLRGAAMLVVRTRDLLRAACDRAWQLGWIRAGFSVLLLAALGVSFFVMPFPSRPPSNWDALLTTAAQVIGAAIAVVFALLVVPVQNAAGRYSPVFLKYIRNDPLLRGLFFWAVIALGYVLAAVGAGSTPWRTAVAGTLTIAVFVALGIAALRVMQLVNPIRLARMVEEDLLRRAETSNSVERARFTEALDQVDAFTGIKAPRELLGVPVSAQLTEGLIHDLAPLLSIAGGAVETGQVDVAEGVLQSVLNVTSGYLQSRGTSTTVDDPLLARVCEELYGLAQGAQRVRSQQMLPQIIRIVGKLADAAIDVSQPGTAFEERNIAVLPLSQLKLIAVMNLANINNPAAAIATTELGKRVYELLKRGLPLSAAGHVQSDLSLLAQAGLRPFAYQISAVSGRWLMYLWSLSCAVPDGQYVRDKVLEAVRELLGAYRKEPTNLDRQVAISTVVDPASGYVAAPRLPAGAAAATGLLWAQAIPPDQDLLEDVEKLGDTLIRELIWPATKDWRDPLSGRWAMQQAVEIAVVLAGIASGTLEQRARILLSSDDLTPVFQAKPQDAAWQSHHVHEQSAKAWSWITKVLMGTCGSLQDAKSPDEVTVEQWETCRLALTGASSNIVGAIACLAKQASPELEQEFGSVIDQLIKLGEELLDAWPQVEDRDPVIQHLRMIGAWLVATKRPKLAKRAAAVVAKASPYTGWDLADSRYPTDLSSDDWHRVPISVAGQYAMPHYLGIVHAFLDHGHREKFEKMIDIARRGAGASAPTERAPLSRTPRAADIPTKRS